MTKPTAWHERGERGSALGMRITVWLYRTVGRRAAELLVWPIVAYFFLTDRAARLIADRWTAWAPKRSDA